MLRLDGRTPEPRAEARIGRLRQRCAAAARRRGNFDLMRPLGDAAGLAARRAYAPACSRWCRSRTASATIASPSTGATRQSLAEHGRRPAQLSRLWLAVGLAGHVGRCGERGARPRRRHASTTSIATPPSSVSASSRTGSRSRPRLVNRGDAACRSASASIPWFPVHDGALVRFAASSLWLCDAEGQAERRIPIPRGGRLFDAATASGRISQCLLRGLGRPGRDRLAARGRRDLSMIADAVHTHLMLHAPADGEPVFCLEPQTAAPCAFDGLESEPLAAGVHILDPAAGFRERLRFDVHP